MCKPISGLDIGTSLLSGKNGKLKYVRGFMGLVDVFLTL
jgi:hypothetical protein